MVDVQFAKIASFQADHDGSKLKISRILSLLIAFLLVLPSSGNGVLAQELMATHDLEKEDWKCSLNELITIVELNLCGKTNPGASMLERLTECERVSGLTTEITASLPVERRVADLMAEAPPATILMDFVIFSSKADSSFFSKRINLRTWQDSLYQLVTALEVATYTKPDLGKSLLKRVERLEKDILNLSDEKPEKNLAERVQALFETIGPNETHANIAIEATAKKWDWLFSTGGDSDSVASKPAADGNLARANSPSVLKQSMDKTRTVLTSPTFWKIVGVTAAAAAATVGFIYLLKRYQNGSHGGFSAYENSCTGRHDCRKCSSCNYCQHCKNPTFIQPCGVYFRVRAIP